MLTPQAVQTSILTSAIASTRAWIVDACAILAAAKRVANAVETRRRPASADLKTLGIRGKLPEAW